MMIDRRCFTSLALLVSLGLAACGKEQPAAPYNVEEVPLSQISDDLAAGKMTSAAITQSYIDRINMYDGPLNGVIAVAPDALQQAAASDARRKDGKALGPLDGVPILLKDNIDAVGMPTTAGSWALEHNMPKQDSEVTRRLRAAGAVILGKANTSQFAGIRTSTGLNGSTVGGGTHNPYDLTKSAAGSSNGPGIAAATSFSAGTIGTETSGSITSPSSQNGVVGIKSTIALVSRRGIVPISLTQDMAGPMTRTVRDNAMILNVIAGSDPGDPWSVDADANKKDYVSLLSTDGLKGKRLAVLRGLRGQDERTTPVFDEALAVLKAQGADLVEVADTKWIDIRPEMRIILLADLKEDLNNYFATMPDTVKVRTVTDLIAFNSSDPRESMHKQENFTDADATVDGRKNPDYQKTLAEMFRITREDGIDRVLKETGAIALVTVTTPPADTIPVDGSTTSGAVSPDPRGSQAASLTAYAASAGYPHISVPMGQVNGMPLGLSFAGTKWAEGDLYPLAYAYEQASKKRVPPTAYKQAVAQPK
ncbi:MAG: amidase family protein [Rhodospirillaceae bacterium]